MLDIGAWDGWFSFEMERRGAEVLALDSAKNTRLLEARRLLGSRIEYRIGDICRLTWKDLGTFDIVLFLGVLYHVKHPVMALENVCGLCRDMACIESFVTEADLNAVPAMEFYETTELRGQLDNWVGPNAACLMAFCRTAGFARVAFEGALGERAHVTGYRKWPWFSGVGNTPSIRCIDNAATHDHNFSSMSDDYATLYFTNVEDVLTCDDVMPQVGGFGSRPIHVASTGGGWQATFKIPPGLDAGWYEAALRTRDTLWSRPLRIGIDLDRETRRRSSGGGDFVLDTRRRWQELRGSSHQSGRGQRGIGLGGCSRRADARLADSPRMRHRSAGRSGWGGLPETVRARSTRCCPRVSNRARPWSVLSQEADDESEAVEVELYSTGR